MIFLYLSHKVLLASKMSIFGQIEQNRQKKTNKSSQISYENLKHFQLNFLISKNFPYEIGARECTRVEYGEILLLLYCV